MKVYLIGYMGVGKTSIGKRLSGKLNYSFSDLDAVIEMTTKTTIPTLFAEIGEEGFRNIESQILMSLSEQDVVIATGGGAPCYNQNMDFMLKNGLVIWLKMTPEMLVSRLLPGKTKRPLIATLKDDEMLNYVKNHLAAREPYFRRAHLKVDVNSMDSTKMENLVEMVQSYSR